MADDTYRRAVICQISNEDFISFCDSDLPFVEVIVSVANGDSTFIEEVGKRFALEIRTGLQNFTTEKGLVLNACACTEVDLKIPLSDENLKVFVLKDVLETHQLHVNEIVWCTEVNPFPLERMVIGILFRERYSWVKSALVAFLRKCLSKGPVTVRENGKLRLSRDQLKRLSGTEEEQWSELSVLQCEPVLQGCLTSETCLVISKLTDQHEIYDSVTSGDDPLPSLVPSNTNEMFLVSDFAHDFSGSQLCKEQLAPSGCSTRTVNQLKASVLNFCEGNYATSTFDASSRLHVSLSTLIDLQMFNGSWVKICTNQNQNTVCDQQQEQGFSEVASNASHDNHSSDKCHIVQIVVTTSSNDANEFFNDDEIFTAHSISKIEDGIAYISTLLYFNLFHDSPINENQMPSIYVYPIPEATQREEHKITSTASMSRKPAFGNEAHISLIHSPHYKATNSFDHALAKHFKTPRMLTVGDIFYVFHIWEEDGDLSMESGSADDQGRRNLVVFFQVTRLVFATQEVKSCLVHMEHTSLYQRGTVHSYVPPVWRRGQFNDLRSSYWEQLSPAGLNSYSAELVNVIRPYFDVRDIHPLPPCGVLLTGPPGAGKRTVARATSKRLNMHTFEVNCFDLIGESVAAIEARLKNVFQRAVFCSPCVLLLCNIHALGKDKEGNDEEPRIATMMFNCLSSLKDDSVWPVVVIATSSSPNDITADMYSCFLHELRFEAPSEKERCDMLRGLAQMLSVGNDMSFEQLAKRTAGLVLADMVTLFSNAANTAAKRLREERLGKMSRSTETTSQTCFPWEFEQELSKMGTKICQQDFENSLEMLQSSLSDAIGAPKIPSVKWEDVGGLAEVKAEILDTVQLPLQHPELFAAGLRRSGVLLYGPPGTGKTLLAKAVATECSLNFLSVKGPELINMYVGQSEQNVREVFSRAQSARPCVIFFDELDSLAPNRGRSGDSGGVMDRVVSQLLAELDGLHKACDVFVIGATNRPDLLDPALLRPGRFDKLLYLGVSEDRGSQLNILKALTRKFNIHPDLQLENIAELCPSNLTGADFYALCSDAILQSVRRKIEELELDAADPCVDDTDIQVTEADFRKALDSLAPSVSQQELKRYKDIQKQFAVANNVTKSR
ncbi:peroxisome assembly factor 2-like [Stylophora pistillata]|uniref:Peroxisomal ATPase PEX6 n=1 Tax=Stylophora pistillata TaxID=50429 RepID=A0A2B4SI85_STYPI|nr:peroxisome assembly factor 2-like [Stylophora pistillata]XP_022786220.1 peroxisome assembly factor 2-like [Stylophora pistillata]PFX28237.1 Peroxisome assembly factor 2 [Stylophora pistillata]